MLKPQYPQHKDDAGKHYWKTFHNLASMYPDNPTPEQKRKFKDVITFSTKHFVCPVCAKHGLEYLQKHPMDKYLDDRRAISDYLCTWHNSVRKEQGKSSVDCSLILADDHRISYETDTLSQKIMSKSLPSPINQTYPDVKQGMDKFKKVSERLIEELCKKSGLPTPAIVFTACPMHPETSCTSFLFDQKTGRNLRKPTIFLNPSVFGLRTITHEFKHYEEKMKGHDMVAADEAEIDRMADEIIRKEFPDDKDYEPRSHTAEIIVKQSEDEIRKHPDIPIAVYPEKRRSKPAGTNETQTLIDPSQKSSWLARYPFYTASLNRTNTHLVASPSEVSPKQTAEQDSGYESRSGFASMFDSLYEPLANTLGLSARDLNEAHTPELVGNTVQTIAESQLSNLGSLAASLIVGLGLTAINVFNKNGMGYTDRKFCAELASHFLWGGIRYANPKSSTRTMNEAREAGVAISRMDWNRVLSVMREGNTSYAVVTPSGQPGVGSMGGAGGKSVISRSTGSPIVMSGPDTTPSSIFAPGGNISRSPSPSRGEDYSSPGAIGAPMPGGGVVGGPFDPIGPRETIGESTGPIPGEFTGRRERPGRYREQMGSFDYDLNPSRNRYIAGGRRPEVENQEYNEYEDSTSGKYVRDRAVRARGQDREEELGLSDDLDEGGIEGSTPESTYSGSESGNSINWWS